MKRPTAEQLLAENAALRARLDEAEQTLDAIRGGDVDAVVVAGPKGDQIFSLVGAESIYRLIVETMKEAAFTVTFDGTILFCNAQFGEFVQRPMEQVVGHRLHEFVAPENVASADSLLLLGGNQSVKQRLVLWNSREQRVPVHVSANVLNQPGGPSICIVAADLTELENSTDLIQQLRRQQEALRDSRIAALNLMKDAVETKQQAEQANEKLCQEIAERQRAEQALRASEAALRDLNAHLESNVAERTAQLQQRTRQLQRLSLEISETEDRERKRMAEILHDDLQQQLAAAKFQMSVLSGRAKYDASVQEVAAEIDRMLKDAIEKSRSLSHDLSPAVMHHGDLGETFRWLAGQVQAKHGLVVHVRAQGEVCAESDALRSFLFKAAQEFLFNAVKHARVNEVRLRVRRFGRYLYLSVSDRGRGFDPQGLREAAGFGLLNIRERVELLGGRMKIQSAPGQGSTFSIVVPDGETPEDRGQKTEDGKKTVKGAPSSVLRHPSSVLRVLLADDHEIVREGLRSVLSEAHDVEVVGEAANGREAVDLASRLKPDVIIMDVSMPLIEGDDATRQIKMYLPQTRVIALSMYNQPEKIEAMSRAGAERYVLKTAPSEELLAAIRGEKANGETFDHPGVLVPVEDRSEK